MRRGKKVTGGKNEPEREKDYKQKRFLRVKPVKSGDRRIKRKNKNPDIDLAIA